MAACWSVYQAMFLRTCNKNVGQSLRYCFNLMCFGQILIFNWLLAFWSSFLVILVSSISFCWWQNWLFDYKFLVQKLTSVTLLTASNAHRSQQHIYDVAGVWTLRPLQLRPLQLRPLMPKKKTLRPLKKDTSAPRTSAPTTSAPTTSAPPKCLLFLIFKVWALKLLN